MSDKLAVYDLYGVEEYRVYDPARNEIGIWIRQGERLKALAQARGWTSPASGYFSPSPTRAWRFTVPRVSLS